MGLVSISVRPKVRISARFCSIKQKLKKYIYSITLQVNFSSTLDPFWTQLMFGPIEVQIQFNFGSNEFPSSVQFCINLTFDFEFGSNLGQTNFGLIWVNIESIFLDNLNFGLTSVQFQINFILVLLSISILVQFWLHQRLHQRLHPKLSPFGKGGTLFISLVGNWVSYLVFGSKI